MRQNQDGALLSPPPNQRIDLATRRAMELATMIRSGKRFVRCAASLTALVVLGWILTGHAAGPDSQGMPTDWSHRHLIFSRPGQLQSKLHGLRGILAIGSSGQDATWSERSGMRNDLGSGILSIGLGYRHFGKVQRDWSGILAAEERSARETIRQNIRFKSPLRSAPTQPSPTM